MKAKVIKPPSPVPAGLVTFDPSQWDSVFDWAYARRRHGKTIPDLPEWVKFTKETRRVVLQVLGTGEV